MNVKESFVYFFASFLIVLLTLGVYWALVYAAMIFMAEWMVRIFTAEVNKHGD